MPVGQAQKEAFVNEALSLLDGLVHCAIEAELANPPTTPTDGAAWLVAPNPGGDWLGHAGELALRQAGQWLYVSPRDGMNILNKGSGQELRMIAGSWRAPLPPQQASGGSVIDAEARTMLADLVLALREAGTFAT